MEHEDSNYSNDPNYSNDSNCSKDFNYRKCSSLRPHEPVVFFCEKRKFLDQEYDVHYDGTVEDVDAEHKVVWVHYLYDCYKSATDPIPFDRMVAVYNKCGKYLKLRDVVGCSDLLLPE